LEMSGDMGRQWWGATLVVCLLVAWSAGEARGMQVNGRRRFQREIVVEDESTLRMAVIIHRHGDRTPVMVPAGHEDRWPLGPGQLTGLGVHQLFELGEHIRSLFSDDFLATSYAPEIITSRASNKDRTLQSAEAMLMALFPPGTGPYYPFENDVNDTSAALPYGFQPVPTHSVELERDWELRAFQNCRKYSEWLGEGLFSSEEAHKKEAEYADVLEELASVFGEEVTLSNLYLFYDYLKCSETHEMQDMVSSAVYQRTQELDFWVWSEEFKPSEHSELIGGPLIGKVLDDFQAMVTGDDTSTRIKLYSAHDVTLACLRSVLGLASLEPPPYASWAMLELHHVDGVWQVHFTYNDQVETMPFCTDHQQGHYCPLSALETALRSKVPADAELACATNEDLASDDQTPDETSGSPLFSSPLVIAVLGVSVLLLGAAVGILVAYVYLLRKDRFLFVHGRGGAAAEDGVVAIEMGEMH